MISSSVMRPWPNCSPLRKTVGTPMIWRSVTSSWNSAPSIIWWLMPGLSTAIRFSACTTSGQLWQDSEMKVSKWKLPGMARISLDHAGVDLRRMAAGLQQGQDQRGEFVPHRDAGKADACRFARAADGERGLAGRELPSCRTPPCSDSSAMSCSSASISWRLVAVIERGDQLDGCWSFSR
jgi:hypothetical protein